MDSVQPIAMDATNSSHKHKPILAERFKTKVCNTFVQTGVCPYEARCMFAHGDQDLRTKQMNLHDNLVTEEAIKAFQRARMIAARAAAQKKAQQLLRKEKRRARVAGAPELLPLAPLSAIQTVPDTDELNFTMDSVKGDTTQAMRAMTPSASPDFKTPATVPGALQSQDGLNASGRSFRHEPYSASPETPRKPSSTTPSRQMTVSPGATGLEPPMVYDGHMPPLTSYQLPPARRTPQPNPLEKQDSFAYEMEGYSPARNRTPSMLHPMPTTQHAMPQVAPCACPDCQSAQHRSGAVSPSTYNSTGMPQHYAAARGVSPSHMSHGEVPSVAAILAGRAPQQVLYQPCGPGGAMMRRGTPQMQEVMLA
jgi:hypothetical protein